MQWTPTHKTVTNTLRIHICAFIFVLFSAYRGLWRPHKGLIHHQRRMRSTDKRMNANWESRQKNKLQVIFIKRYVKVCTLYNVKINYCMQVSKVHFLLFVVVILCRFNTLTQKISVQSSDGTSHHDRILFLLDTIPQSTLQPNVCILYSCLCDTGCAVCWCFSANRHCAQKIEGSVLNCSLLSVQSHWA